MATLSLEVLSWQFSTPCPALIGPYQQTFPFRERWIDTISSSLPRSYPRSTKWILFSAQFAIFLCLGWRSAGHRNSFDWIVGYVPDSLKPGANDEQHTTSLVLPRKVSRLVASADITRLGLSHVRRRSCINAACFLPHRRGYFVFITASPLLRIITSTTLVVHCND